MAVAKEKYHLRSMVRGTYAIQKLRIQMGNRIVANFKVKMGQDPGKSEETMSKEAKDILKKIRVVYKLLTDGVIGNMPTKKKFKGDAVISSYTELCLINEYETLQREEEKHFRLLGSILEDFPIYTEFLKDVHGCGPAMSGVIVSEIDITRSKYPSSLWKYSGLDVGDDGAGRSKRKEHLVRQKYTNREGKEDERDSITFNPFLKTKLVGVLADCFIRSGNEKYVKVYKDTKHRYEHHARFGTQNDGKKEEGKIITSKGRRDRMGKRKMIKIFLLDLYLHWRKLEELPVSRPYSEDKLGMPPHGEQEPPKSPKLPKPPKPGNGKQDAAG